MATLNEIAVLVAEPLGRVLDAAFLEQVKARAKYWRSKLLRDSLNKSGKDRAYFIQSLGVPMEEVSAVSCGLPLDCKVMRSKFKLPQPVRANNILFDYIGGVDGMNPFQLVARWKIPLLLKDKYAHTMTTYAAYENGYIILPKNNLITNIRVDYITDEPEALADLNCGTGNCDFSAEEYPVSGDIAQMIVQYILQVDFNRPPLTDDKTEVHVNDNPQQ